VREMETKMVAKMITERIYRMYGSESGVLFGLPPEKRRVVESIVGIALELYENEFREKIEDVVDVLKRIYESEINFSVKTFWDAGVEVAILDGYGDIVWRGFYETYDLAIAKLVEKVLEGYSESEFAQEIKRRNEGGEKICCTF
jgi:hypothetical protein